MIRSRSVALEKLRQRRRAMLMDRGQTIKKNSEMLFVRGRKYRLRSSPGVVADMHRRRFRCPYITTGAIMIPIDDIEGTAWEERTCRAGDQAQIIGAATCYAELCP